jgi:hypothetical protein
VKVDRSKVFFGFLFFETLIVEVDEDIPGVTHVPEETVFFVDAEICKAIFEVFVDVVTIGFS